MSNKKADMTLNIVIGAVIVIVVMVIVIMIFVNGMGNFSHPCDSKVGGNVLVASQCGKSGSLDPTCIVAGNFNNVQSGQICCSTADRCRP